NRVVDRLNRPRPALPAIIVEAPAETLHRDGGNCDLDALVNRRRQPRLNAAHADADHADPVRVDLRPRPQVIDSPPEVPAGVVEPRVSLPLAGFGLPGP